MPVLVINSEVIKDQWCGLSKTKWKNINEHINKGKLTTGYAYTLLNPIKIKNMKEWKVGKGKE